MVVSVRLVVVILIAVAGSGACGNGSSDGGRAPVEGSTSTTTTTTPATPTTTAATSVPPAVGEPLGRAVMASDVGTVPDQPLGGGTVVLVPSERSSEFWAATDVGPAGPAELRRAEVVRPDAPAETWGGVELAIGPDGTFPYSNMSGTTLVCLLVDARLIAGCAVVDLVSGSALTVSVGEAGVAATLS